MILYLRCFLLISIAVCFFILPAVAQNAEPLGLAVLDLQANNIVKAEAKALSEMLR